MYEYIFLYALAILAIIFAIVQDFRFREISNWVTFSLISFVLSYRLAYSLFLDDNFSFFLFGLGGVILFVIFGYALYYGRVFAGGDAKLLFGLGGILPYNSLTDYLIYGIGFVALLLLAGVAYTLIYTIFLAARNWKTFSKNFTLNFNRYRGWFFVSLVIGLFVLLFANWMPKWYSLLFPLLFLVLVYARSIENSCMIKLVSADKLTEGDWLVHDVKAGKKTIYKTVHGLSYSEIVLLRKYGKKVLIKSGVPFAPAFLFALLLFLLFYAKILRYSPF